MSKRLPYLSRIFVLAQALDGVGEVQVDAQARVAHAAALVADLLGGAAGDVAGGQVAEGGVLALQVVVALVLGDLVRAARLSPFFLGTQMRPSLRRLSDMSVSFDWWSPVTGMQVGWICV